jgi:hypothetical protein
MTCRLLMAAAVAAVVLTPSIGLGVAEAHGVSGHSGGAHSGGNHHRSFFVGRGLRGNGFGYGYFLGYADSVSATEVPYVLAVPQPPSPVLAVDRPPCRETTPEGVVVERGTSCSQGAK